MSKELISAEQLQKIFPNAKGEKCKLYADAFNKVLPQYAIDTPKRIAVFLGQIGVESGELKYDRELPSTYNKVDPKDKGECTGSRYCNRKASLGNYVCVANNNSNKHTADCDGPKYIGRGILQITGRANYARYGPKVGADLIKNPELACDPYIATKIACEYFRDRNINSQSDAWSAVSLAKCTELVNGTAKLHHAERVKYAERARKILENTENVNA